MKIFAISDLHLSSNSDKPMDVFGESWRNHFGRIKESWESLVGDDDIVLLSGDTSWGTKIEEGIEDLKLLTPLKGKKVFIRGNHDYWWNGITKLRRGAPDDAFYFLQNDCVRFDGVVICGSRGWTCPGATDFTDDDLKLYKREAERFKLCFQEVNKVKKEGDKLIALIHFPPFSPKIPDSDFTRLFEENGVEKVIFGHIHGKTYFPLRTQKNGIEYLLTSCDKLDFNLLRIL